MEEGASVVVGASVVASLVGFVVVTDAFVEGPDGFELITTVEAAVAEAVVVDISCTCDDVGRVDIEDGVTDSVGVSEVLCPDTPVKV